MSEDLVVGRYHVPFSVAEGLVRTYTTRPAGKSPRRDDFYAWPFYDGYDSGSKPNMLNDGDLLAPVLLNVDPGIHGFASLQAMRPALENLLADVPDDVDLAVASPAAIAAVARLFAVLDSDQKWLGVRGTTLSKALHRKRPRLIPLHDQHVRDAYVPSRLKTDPKRSWSDYMTVLMNEMRADLSRATTLWERLESIPPTGDPRLTRLRVLDIIAWSKGNRRTKGKASKKTR